MRVACETLVATNLAVLACDLRTEFSVSDDELEEISQRCVRTFGYEQDGFHRKSVNRLV